MARDYISLMEKKVSWKQYSVKAWIEEGLIVCNVIQRNAWLGADETDMGDGPQAKMEI